MSPKSSVKSTSSASISSLSNPQYDSQSPHNSQDQQAGWHRFLPSFKMGQLALPIAKIGSAFKPDPDSPDGPIQLQRDPPSLILPNVSESSLGTSSVTRSNSDNELQVPYSASSVSLPESSITGPNLDFLKACMLTEGASELPGDVTCADAPQELEELKEVNQWYEVNGKSLQNGGISAGPFNGNPDVFCDVLYENQRGGFLFGKGLFSARVLGPLDYPPWMTPDKKPSFGSVNVYGLPDPSWEWRWPKWYVDMAGDVDAQGWSYAFIFQSAEWHSSHAWFRSFVRRRKWVRLRQKKLELRNLETERRIGLDPDLLVSLDGGPTAANRPSAVVPVAPLTGGDLRQFPIPGIVDGRGNSAVGSVSNSGSSGLNSQVSLGAQETPEVHNLLKKLASKKIDRERTEELLGSLEEIQSDSRQLKALAEVLSKALELYVFYESKRLLLEHLDRKLSAISLSLSSRMLSGNQNSSGDDERGSIGSWTGLSIDNSTLGSGERFAEAKEFPSEEPLIIVTEADESKSADEGNRVMTEVEKELLDSVKSLQQCVEDLLANDEYRQPEI